MVKLFELLFSLNGRIRRKDWWLGTLTLILVGLASSYLFVPGAFDFTSETPPPPVWSDTTVQLILLIPAVALSVKRLADCNWPAWPVYGLIPSWIFPTVGPHFGYFTDFSSVDKIGEFWIEAAFGIPTLLLIAWNGFVPGTRGPNRFGDDPLAPRTALAS